MNAVTPILFTTPDGVERTLRATHGAKKRIVNAFGTSDLQAILNKYDDAAFPDLLWALMFDEHGKPPAGLDLNSFLESMPLGDMEFAARASAAITSALTQGKVSKNELEARLLEEMSQTKVNGSNSGASVRSALDSQTSNSGTATSNVKSQPASNGIASVSDSKTLEPA